VRLADNSDVFRAHDGVTSVFRLWAGQNTKSRQNLNTKGAENTEFTEKAKNR